jgi:hypothetical protein
MTTSSFAATARLRYLRIVVAAAFTLGIFLSLPLWFAGERGFPRLPIFESLSGFRTDWFFSILLLVALILTAAKPFSRFFPGAAVGLIVALVMFDQTRLQPWVYQYAIMLALLAFAFRASDNTANASVLAANQLVVAALYFWSGVQKLNWSFGHEVVPGLFQSAHISIPPWIESHLTSTGIVVAIAESLVGTFLLFRRTRQSAVIAALAVHLVVLLILIIAWRNSVVWPWNLGMMVMLVLLFWRCDQPTLGHVVRRWRGSEPMTHLPKAVLVVCGVLPILSFAGCWDLYLSAALYAGNASVGVMHIREDVRDQLSTKAQTQIFTTSRGELMLPFHEWSMSELNVPPYPEVRTFRQVAKQLCRLSDGQPQNELIIRGRPALSDGSYEVARASCKQLLER